MSTGKHIETYKHVVIYREDRPMGDKEVVWGGGEGRGHTQTHTHTQTHS